MFEILAKVATDAEYTCGSVDNFVFSGMFPYIVSTIVTIIQIVVPILLIVFGMLDLAKAVIVGQLFIFEQKTPNFFEVFHFTCGNNFIKNLKAMSAWEFPT